MSEAEKAQTNPRTVSGVVVSDRMQKGITIKVERRVKHPVYGKYVRKSSKIHAHDEENACKIGDTVTVIDVVHCQKQRPGCCKASTFGLLEFKDQ